MFDYYKWIIISSLVAYVHRINQLTPHPNQPSSLISAASGNNEVSIWDMETAARRQMIWASPAQPFGAMTDNVNTVILICFNTYFGTLYFSRLSSIAVFAPYTHVLLAIVQYCSQEVLTSTFDFGI